MINISQGMSDQELLKSYLAGNKEAISRLIERHSSRVYDYIRMMVKDRELADDIYQETFIKVVKVIDEGRYKENGKFLSWVMRIAHNQVIDHFRSEKQNKSVNEASAGYDILSTQRLTTSSIEEQMVGEQIEADVRRLVELLPDEQREVVRLRYYGGLSFKEIAEHTEVSINTALGRMRYALINLRRMIKEKNVVLE
jgi:RNA polymerase sigma-70 factor (ECF subfamily)